MIETLLILLTLGVWCLLGAALVAWQINRETKIMAKLEELAGIVNGLKDQVTKSKIEIIGRIAALEEALKNVELPAGATAALEALKTEVQAVDDLNPDAPAPE